MGIIECGKLLKHLNYLAGEAIFIVVPRYGLNELLFAGSDHFGLSRIKDEADVAFMVSDETILFLFRTKLSWLSL